MAVNNSDIEIVFQNNGSFIGRFVKSGVKSIRPAVLIDFISLCNKSFKSLTCVGKVQCCFESILFQHFDFYFCFPTSNVHPFSYEPTRNCACDIKKLFHVRSYL